jgi:phosphopantothenoylcysteine decarboxylase/phosphopantothenate--cysteine ligase
MLTNKRVLLIISGGIAAYKALELIRLLRREGASVRCVLTKGGAQFVTPLSVSALAGEKVYDDLWSLTDEAEMGHIRLARDCACIVVAPASADIIAKIAGGHADDLATTALLATDRPVIVCPAMNPFMWANKATAANIATLTSRGITIVGPEAGEMACGEEGLGRLAELPVIMEAIRVAAR